MTERHTSFPKTSRLKLASDFRDLLKNGKSFCENGLVIYFRRSEKKQSRLGIIVSKRVLKRAVDRNRAKRVIREQYRKEKNNFQDSFDIVIRIVDNCNLLKLNSLRLALNRLFNVIARRP